MNAAIKLDRQEFQDKLFKIFDTHRDIKELVDGEDESVLRFSMVNVKTNSLDAFKFVKQESNNQLAQWDDSMSNYNCIKKDKKY